MKCKFLIIIILIGQSAITQQVEQKLRKKLESSFSKFAKKSVVDTSSKYSEYAKASSNKVYYNTSLGESKYDKDINLDTDVNPSDVKGSIENFRTKKRNEEIWFYTKILICLIIISLAFHYAKKYLSRRKV